MQAMVAMDRSEPLGCQIVDAQLKKLRDGPAEQLRRSRVSANPAVSLG